MDGCVGNNNRDVKGPEVSAVIGLEGEKGTDAEDVGGADDDGGCGDCLFTLQAGTSIASLSLDLDGRHTHAHVSSVFLQAVNMLGIVLQVINSNTQLFFLFICKKIFYHMESET